MLRMGVGLLVGVWIARYLGPEQFGLMNYAMAIVALFGAVASLGLNGIVVRDLVQNPEAAHTTLGSAFLLQVVGGCLAFGLAISTIQFFRPDDGLSKLMVAVLGSVMVFKSTDVVRYWFESQVSSKYIVWVENGILLTMAGVKVGFILARMPLMAFVWAAFAEGLLMAAALLGMYAWRAGALSLWRMRMLRARGMIRDSWPLILSGLAVMIYMRIDQVMLGQMLGDEAVGIYTAAVRISEVWYFIPMIIVSSVFPSIIEAKKQGEAQYYRRLQQLYNLMVLLALLVALPMTFFSDGLVVLLFGEGYAQAGTVLALHVWTGLFVFLGVASGSWYLTENLQLLAFNRTLLGGITNILANLVLIPKYGILGAAMGTILSQFAAAYLFDLLHPKTRYTFRMKTKALLSFYRYGQ